MKCSFIPFSLESVLVGFLINYNFEIRNFTTTNVLFGSINVKINPFLWTSVTITGWRLTKRWCCSGSYLIISLFTYCLCPHRLYIKRQKKGIIPPVAARVANFITSIWSVTIHNLAKVCSLSKLTNRRISWMDFSH